jgi:hypothetical protein
VITRALGGCAVEVGVVCCDLLAVVVCQWLSAQSPEWSEAVGGVQRAVERAAAEARLREQLTETATLM